MGKDHTVLPVPAMTEKDRGDLEAGLAAGADWIAVSFVQRPEDVAEVKKVAAGRALVMAKIEKPQALTRVRAASRRRGRRGRP
jgi:pyruvate kinase